MGVRTWLARLIAGKELSDESPPAQKEAGANTDPPRDPGLRKGHPVVESATSGTSASTASGPDGEVAAQAEGAEGNDSSTELAPRPSSQAEESTPDGGTDARPDMDPQEPDPGQAASESDDPTGLEPEDATDREPDADMDPTSGVPHERLDDIEPLLERHIGRVLEAFNNKVRYDAAKEKHFDRLHQELEQYRSDVLQRASRPLVHGMIGLHGDVGRLVSAWRKEGEEVPLDKWLDRFEELREDIELLLDDHGVTAYGGNLGVPFDGKLQTVVGKVATTDDGKHGTVAESRRPGFEQGKRILVRERVVVFEFQAPERGGTDQNHGELKT